MTYKLLSVVIPVDNTGTDLTHCVAALLRQTPVPDEIIIVHRESDISTADAVRAFSAQHHVIIAVLPAGETQHLCDFAIGLAQGQWLYCCDPAGMVSDGFCADFSQAVSNHPALELFCFNTRTDEANPSFIARNYVAHTQPGLMTGPQAFSDMLQNDVCNSVGCNFVVQKNALDSGQIMHNGSLCQDSAYMLEVFLRSGQTWVSNKCHYSLRLSSAVVPGMAKDESNFHIRYDTFVRGYEKLIRLVDDSHVSHELRRLYLIQSFKSMLTFSQTNRIQPPAFFFNAIHYFGRRLRAGSLTNWFLLRWPELYHLLYRIKSGTDRV